jgi:DNA-binding transcriptional LysR family regulator
MGDFKREHPGLTLSLKISDTKEIVQELLQGQIEFGVVGAKVNHPSLHYEKFEEDEIIVVAPCDHPLTRKESVTLEELLKEPWIVREEGSGTQMAVEKALRKKGRRLKDFNVAIELGSTSSVKEAVKARLGLAFISRIAVEEELARSRFAPIKTQGLESISRQIYIVLQRGKTVSPVGMEFLRFLKKRREVERTWGFVGDRTRKIY